MWETGIVGVVFSASAVIFFGSLFGSFGIGQRSYVAVTTRDRFRLITLISGAIMVAVSVTLIVLKGSVLAASSYAVGSFIGVLVIILFGEFWRWKKVPTRKLRKRYWRYRWVQAKTTVFAASTADYSVLLRRDPESNSPDMVRLLNQLERSTRNVSDEQWRTMLANWNWRKEWEPFNSAVFPKRYRGWHDFDDDQTRVANRIAALPDVPSEWLAVLALHPNEGVRTEVARNPSSSDETKVTAALMGVRPL